MMVFSRCSRRPFLRSGPPDITGGSEGPPDTSGKLKLVALNINSEDIVYAEYRWCESCPSNTIKRLCLCLCWFVCPSRSLLRHIKSVWKARGIVRTVSAMACYIPSFKKFHARVHAISRNFHAILAISAIFGPISTCWVSKCMYSS